MFAKVRTEWRLSSTRHTSGPSPSVCVAIHEKRYKDWSASNHATGGPPNKAHARRCRQDQIAANASVNRLYTKRVGTKLSIANRYLRNPEVRERTVAKSVATSSAIEGIRAPFAGGAKTGASSKNRLKRKRP